MDNDAAIFNKVTEELERLGCEESLCGERFRGTGCQRRYHFDMARDKATIARLVFGDEVHW